MRVRCIPGGRFRRVPVRRIAVIFITLMGLTLSVSAQERGRGAGPGGTVTGAGVGRLTGEFTPSAPPEIVNQPAPRLPDGTLDISGPWVGGGSNDDIERDGGLKPGEFPLLPWAKALRDSRKEQDEPYLYCTPMGIPRMNPYPWRFVQSYTAKGANYIFVIHENGDAGGHRQIFMDGRKHPVDPIPTWWGH